MSSDVLSEQEWAIRLFVYSFFVENAQPPTAVETAGHFGMSTEAAKSAYHRLHDAHTLFLEPSRNGSSDNIRMAYPLSAVPTDYRVTVNGKALWANCAWDSMGIPAMLHRDAAIEATIRPTGETVRYAIQDGTLMAGGNAAGTLIHFALPFVRWYDDLVDT